MNENIKKSFIARYIQCGLMSKQVNIHIILLG